MYTIYEALLEALIAYQNKQINEAMRIHLLDLAREFIKGLETKCVQQ